MCDPLIGRNYRQQSLGGGDEFDEHHSNTEFLCLIIGVMDWSWTSVLYRTNIVLLWCSSQASKIPSLLNENCSNMLYVHTRIDIRYSCDGSNKWNTLCSYEYT